MRYIDADKIEMRLPIKYDHDGDVLVSLRDIYNCINQMPTANPYEWISVEDRLPEETGSYIVATSNGAVCTAKYWHGTAWKPHWNGTIAKHITHWMPLPMHPGVKQ